MLLNMKSHLASLDIFGVPIGVNYKGQGTFKTWLGVLCSVPLIIIMLINFISLLVAFNDGRKQDEKT